MSSKQSAEQLAAIIAAATAALAALNAPSGKKGKSGGAKKSASAEKKPRAESKWNQEVRQVYEEMQAEYYSENPSADGMTPEEIRSAAKKGDLPPFPTYPQALAEASRRRCAEDPEALKKHQAHRAKREAHIAAKKAEKAAPSSEEEESEEEEESVKKAPVKKAPVKKAPAPKSPEPEEEEEEEEEEEKTSEDEFSEVLEHDGKKYAMNQKGWVVNSEGEWVGIWNPVKRTLNKNAKCPF